MSFLVSSKLEKSCPHVSHCPHLGEAAIGIVVRLANQMPESPEYLRRTEKQRDIVESRVLVKNGKRRRILL